ncbi:hypothetical protein AB0H73_09940 [Streptomyces olivoreticuli]
MTSDEYTVRIEHSGKTYASSSHSAFGALSEIRKRLQEDGLIPALEGARVDVYPSRMPLEMGGGRHSQRRPAEGPPYTIGIFDDVPETDYTILSSVTEQLMWIKEHRELTM